MFPLLVKYRICERLIRSVNIKIYIYIYVFNVNSFHDVAG
jgi:hypothetical protein